MNHLQINKTEQKREENHLSMREIHMDNVVRSLYRITLHEISYCKFYENICFSFNFI